MNGPGKETNIVTYFVSNEKVILYSTKNITSFLMNAFDEFFKVSSATEGSLTDVIRERNVIPEKIGTLLNSPNDVKKNYGVVVINIGNSYFLFFYFVTSPYWLCYVHIYSFSYVLLRLKGFIPTVTPAP